MQTNQKEAEVINDMSRQNWSAEDLKETEVRHLKRDDVVMDDFWKVWKKIDFVGPGTYPDHTRLVFKASDMVQLPRDFTMLVLRPESNSFLAATTRFMLHQQAEMDERSGPYDRRWLYTRFEDNHIRILKSDKPRFDANDFSMKTMCFVGFDGHIYLPTLGDRPSKTPMGSVYNADNYWVIT